MHITLWRRLGSAAILAAAWAGLAACGFVGVQGTSEWTKSYTLAPGGSLEITTTNGEVDIEPGEGNTVSVVAEKVARGATEAAAKEAAAAIEIKESVSPSRIALETRQEGGFFNGNRQVRFHIKAPAWVAAKIVATNGEISVRGLTGDIRVRTTNGRIRGTALEGRAAAETTNGQIDLEFTKIPEDGITCSATNGEIIVTIPKDGSARIAADVTNGGIDTDNLTLTGENRSRRHFDATLNGGGPSIKIDTTNGAIKVRGR